MAERAEFFALKIEPVSMDLLPPASRKRIAKFRLSADSYRSIWGEILTRVLLSRWTGEHPLKVGWAINGNGKPVFPDGRICFNIAHSGEYVVAAVDDFAVGADIEKIHPVNEKIFARVFMEGEINRIKKAADPELEFYRIWTLKESYVKNTGCGIPELKTFDVTGLIPGIEFAGFEFDGYAASVCSLAGRAPGKVQFCDTKTVLAEYQPVRP